MMFAHLATLAYAKPMPAPINSHVYKKICLQKKGKAAVTVKRATYALPAHLFQQNSGSIPSGKSNSQQCSAELILAISPSNGLSFKNSHLLKPLPGYLPAHYFFRLTRVEPDPPRLH